MTISNVPATYLSMVENAASLGKSIKTHETTVGKKANAWGRDFLVNVKIENYSADTLIGDTKQALGWPKLVGDGGKAVKKRFNVWFSNIRLVLENWDRLDDDVRKALLAGERSFTTVAKAIQDTERAIKKETEEAKADTDTDTDTDTESNLLSPAPLANDINKPGIGDMAERLILALNAADTVALNAAQERLAALMAAIGDAADRIAAADVAPLEING